MASKLDEALKKRGLLMRRAAKGATQKEKEEINRSNQKISLRVRQWHVKPSLRIDLVGLIEEDNQITES